MIKFFRKLWRDRRGNALVIAGAALPLLSVRRASPATPSNGCCGSASSSARPIRRRSPASMPRCKARQSRSAINHRRRTRSTVSEGRALRRPIRAMSLQAEPAITYPTITNRDQRGEGVADDAKVARRSREYFYRRRRSFGDATAATVRTGAYCVVSLEKYERRPELRQPATRPLTCGCGMITNSTSLNAAIATGSSSVTASPIAAVGDIQDSTHWNGAELPSIHGCGTIRSPRSIRPTFTGCQGGSNRNQPQQSARRCSTGRLTTGVQCVSDINVSGTLKLGSATYVVDGGNFSAGAQAQRQLHGLHDHLHQQHQRLHRDDWRHHQHQRRRAAQHDRAKQRHL